jgi:hypothetical protein
MPISVPEDFRSDGMFKEENKSRNSGTLAGIRGFVPTPEIRAEAKSFSLIFPCLSGNSCQKKI